MNDEQKSLLAHFQSMAPQAIPWRDVLWFLALVKELSEENARLSHPRATLYSESDVAQELKRVEQRLAAVTAERDELKHAVEREAAIATRRLERAEKAEAERDALRVVADEARKVCRIGSFSNRCNVDLSPSLSAALYALDCKMAILKGGG